MVTFEDEFLDFFIQVFRNFGLDTLGAKLIGALFLEPGELSLDELSNRTGYSLASVSSKLKSFESLGLIKRLKKPGSKKIYYYMDSDVTVIMRNKFRAFNNLYFEPAKKVLPTLIERNKNKNLTPLERKKLQIIIDYYAQIKKIERLMSEMSAKLEKM